MIKILRKVLTKTKEKGPNDIKIKTHDNKRTEKPFSFSSKLIILLILVLLVLSGLNLAYQVLTNTKSAKNMKYCYNADQIIYEGTVVNGYAINFNENKMLGCQTFKETQKGYELTYINNNALSKNQYINDKDFKCTYIIRDKMTINTGCSPVQKIWQCNTADGMLYCQTNQNPFIEKKRKDNSTVYEEIVPGQRNLTYTIRQSNVIPHYLNVFERLNSPLFLKSMLSVRNITIEPVSVTPKKIDNF